MQTYAFSWNKNKSFSTTNSHKVDKKCLCNFSPYARKLVTVFSMCGHNWKQNYVDANRRKEHQNQQPFSLLHLKRKRFCI